MLATCLLTLAATAAPVSSVAAPTAPGDSVVLRAGTVYTLAGDQVLRPGALLVRDGKIAAVGAEIADAPGMRVVDYGPDAVIVPGFVAANSPFGGTSAGARTAELDLRAIDAFDPYTTYWPAVSAGVTSFYIAPARGRLIAGQGAVVKSAGADARKRVLAASTGIHGTITAEARRTPGFWEPRVPATADVGLGVEEAQLPRTVMGAVVALDELLELAAGRGDVERYGPYVGPQLAEMMRNEAMWRIGAETAPEMRALLAFCRQHELPFVLEGAQEAREVLDELASSGAPVIVIAPIQPDRDPRDLGKGRDAAWPRFDVAAALAERGVKFAIATPADTSPLALSFAAQAASQGGLSKERALRAITIDAAEILGVAARVGSLAVGKDADLVVLNGPPLETGTSVVATWISGEVAWKARETSAVVLSVDTLYLGDGETLSPAEILIDGGRIVEVGRRVGRPQGSSVVRGPVAMPGLIDTLGHLGLEGSGKVPPSRFALARIVEPGDFADRRVARSGVTTVALSPRGSSGRGVQMMAYKPASEELELQVVADPVALRMQWTDRNRVESGKAVRQALEKAVAYVAKWDEYEKALAEWTPPAAGEAEKKDEKAEAKEAEAEKEPAAGKDADKKEADKKDTDKKKSKKKKDDAPPAPISGAWVAWIVVEGGEPVRLRVAFEDREGRLEGVLRCALLTEGLVDVAGERAVREVTLEGTGTEGAFELVAKVVELEEEGQPRKLVGTAKLGAAEHAFEAEQTEKEYKVASRPERRREKEAPRPKGEPRAPGVDPDLEPLRRAMRGETAILVEVERRDEILACVEAFEAVGIEPVLVGAGEAHFVADQIAGRIAGILPSNDVLRAEPKARARLENAYAQLVEAGIPVAFHSAAEEGAAELWNIAAWAVANGLSSEAALRGLTAGAADLLAIDDRVGRISAGLDADVLLLDGDPLDPATRVLRVWVAGEEVRR